MLPGYSVAQYLTDLRAIRLTGSATAETSFHPPLDRLLNAAGQKLTPTILFSTQLRNSEMPFVPLSSLQQRPRTYSRDLGRAAPVRQFQINPSTVYFVVLLH